MGEKDWVSRTISAFALVASVASVVFSGLTYRSGQEDLAIVVRRDWRSPIEKEAVGVADADYEDIDGIRMRWFVQLTNVSTSATLSITDIESTAWQFTGTGLPAKRPAWAKSDTGTFMRIEDHKPVTLPLRLLAGETVGLETLATFSVKKGVAWQFSARPVEPRPGTFMMPALRDANGVESDYFGNVGTQFPDGDILSFNPSAVRQPRLEVRVETGRGLRYSASGGWYRRVQRQVK